MQISALSSALTGMNRASRMLDSAAAQVADDAMPLTADLSSPPSSDDDGLITAVPNLMLAGALFKANAVVARTAQETYASVLDLYSAAGRNE